MGFQIIGDSSLDLNNKLKSCLNAKLAPFQITVGGKLYIDDDNIDCDDLLYNISSSSEVAKTSAPTPYEFLNLVDPNTDGVFIITISSKMSASYNSALIAQQLLKEKYPELNVHVIDSRTASSGETHLAVEIKRKEKEGCSFEQTVEYIDNFRNSYELLFLLDKLDTLIKNGRMSFLTGLFAQFLHIKPLLRATKEGEIGLYDKTRTYSKALDKLAEYIVNTKNEMTERILLISQCKAESRAQLLKEKIESSQIFKEIIIVPMRGLSSTYANEGGIICSF